MPQLTLGAYQLFALDLDGTVLEEGQIPQRVCSLLAVFCERGGTVTIATGRSIHDIKKIIKQSEIPKHAGFPQYLLSGDKNIYRCRKGRYVPLSAWNRVLDQRWQKALPLVQQAAERAEQTFRAHKLTFELSYKSMREIRKRGVWTWSFPSVADARRAHNLLKSIATYVPDVEAGRGNAVAGLMCKGVSKGAGMSRIAYDLGLEMNQVLVVGNSYNDLSMLGGTYGFASATVANAPAEIKKVVLKNNGYVASAPLGEGVCEIIEKVLLHVGNGKNGK